MMGSNHGFANSTRILPDRLGKMLIKDLELTKNEFVQMVASVDP